MLICHFLTSIVSVEISVISLFDAHLEILVFSSYMKIFNLFLVFRSLTEMWPVVFFFVFILFGTCRAS